MRKGAIKLAACKKNKSKSSEDHQEEPPALQGQPELASLMISTISSQQPAEVDYRDRLRLLSINH
jgi:hypothetical protein